MPDYSDFFAAAFPGLRTVSVGELYLPSGQLYCCDPFLSDEVGALEQQVPAGRYIVELCLAQLPDWGERVALARVRLSAQTVTQWRPAEYVHQDERQAWFPVDAGLACFMDRDTEILLRHAIAGFYRAHPEGNYYDDLLASAFAANASPPGVSGDWAMHAPAPDNPANIAMFASGLGDGSYSAWWGLDAAGEPAMLVADFGLLEAP